MALAEVRAGIAVLLVGGLVGTACQLPSQPTRAPSPPSAEAFNFDVSFFATHTPDATASSANWATVLEHVAYLDSIVEGFFRVPRATLEATASVLATRSGGYWDRAYSLTIDGHAYAGYVRGAGIGSTDNFQIVVSAPTLTPAVNNYLWAEGAAAAGQNIGIWFVHLPAFTGPVETIRLDWTTPTPTTRHLVLQRVASLMNYELTATTASIEYMGTTPAESFRANWNLQTGTGSVAVGFEAPLCWDAGQHDVACP